MTYLPIENYGVIGNMHTIALVGMNGSIDFMCFPYFDSPSIFAGLLDHEQGGRFQIYPTIGTVREKQIYLPDTAILLTRFLSNEGIAEIVDFMPVVDGQDHHSLVRQVRAVQGNIQFRLHFDPRFNYARSAYHIEQRSGEITFISDGPDKTAIRLRTPLDLTIQDGIVRTEFSLQAGETISFILEEVESESYTALSSTPNYVEDTFEQTATFWRNWSQGIKYQGRWREIVYRSAITLKLLTSIDTGAVVAAPTFGLPEGIGGERNWDYRYTWVRDASFTMYAMLRLGLVQEAHAFMYWVEERVNDLNPDGSLQIMYGIDGRKRLTEQILTHFEGYRGSKPVRIGNGAYDQLQLDIYGELMDTIYIFNKYGEPVHHDLWVNLVRLVDWVCENWQRPDEGIWEVRGGQREFSTSRLMCWVAVDRGIRLATKRSFPAPLDRWLKVRNAIYEDIFNNFWNAERQAFVQYKGATAVDASTLLMPLVKFISPTDPRWLSTMKVIQRDLVEDSLVYRYKIGDAADDGLAGEEGAFGICTFWYVEALGRTGDLTQARYKFEKMLGFANHLGLYAEEIGAHGEFLGNFPQAFTHLALISAAYDLDRRLSAS